MPQALVTSLAILEARTFSITAIQISRLESDFGSRDVCRGHRSPPMELATVEATQPLPSVDR